MTTPKNPLITALTSRGVIGGVLAVAAGVFGFTAEDTAELETLITNGGAVVGGLLAVIGRIRAKREIAPK